VSGIDEQVPICECPECGGIKFRKTVYGTITSRINTGSNRTYGEDAFDEDDCDDWECENCFTRADAELKGHILDLVRELS